MMSELMVQAVWLNGTTVDYELLPYHRFGLGKYESLGVVYELDDYKTPSDEVVQKFQKIIDEAFGRSRRKFKVPN